MKQLKKLLTDERGAYTLEAALVFPLLLVVIVTMMLAALYMYQIVHLQYVTTSTVERASNIWDKQDRDLKTGNVQSNTSYGLYENDLLKQLVTTIIPINNSGQASSVSFVSPQAVAAATHASFLGDKLEMLQVNLSAMPIHANGKASYYTPAILPRIEVQMKQQLTSLSFQNKELIPSPSYRAYRSLVQPTGFIRNIDLVIYYSQKISAMNSLDQAKWKEKGGKAVASFSP